MYSQFIEATGLSSPSNQWNNSVRRGPRILGDLLGTHFLARFVLFHFHVLFISRRAYISVSQMSVPDPFSVKSFVGSASGGVSGQSQNAGPGLSLSVPTE